MTPDVAAAPAPAVEDTSLLGRIKAFRHRHETAEMALFFVGGFLIDVATLGRIDDQLELAKQGVYLVILGLLLALDQRHHLQHDLPAWLSKALKLSEEAIHFFLGSLLSMITLFFFLSASGITSLLFLVVVFGLLVANELPRFRALGPMVRFGLYAFCVASYFAYLLPVLMGALQPWLFVAAIACAAVVLGGLGRLLLRWSGGNAKAVRRTALYPSAGVLGVLLLLFFLKAIPPVPLAVQFMGVYHGVDRETKGGDFQLAHLRPSWKLWHHGDQDFAARPGDKIYVYVRIFAPSRFHDRVKIRWSYDDPNGGWRSSDAIPLTISGGRDQGFRGWAYKANYQPGNWRVEVETEDGRDIGLIHFTVRPDAETGPRVFKVDPG